jgi:hypothetical protein
LAPVRLSIVFIQQSLPQSRKTLPELLRDLYTTDESR